MLESDGRVVGRHRVQQQELLVCLQTSALAALGCARARRGAQKAATADENGGTVVIWILSFARFSLTALVRPSGPIRTLTTGRIFTTRSLQIATPSVRRSAAVSQVLIIPNGFQNNPILGLVVRRHRGSTSISAILTTSAVLARLVRSMGIGAALSLVRRPSPRITRLSTALRRVACRRSCSNLAARQTGRCARQSVTGHKGSIVTGVPLRLGSRGMLGKHTVQHTRLSGRVDPPAFSVFVLDRFLAVPLRSVSSQSSAQQSRCLPVVRAKKGQRHEQAATCRRIARTPRWKQPESENINIKSIKKQEPRTQHHKKQEPRTQHLAESSHCPPVLAGLLFASQ